MYVVIDQKDNSPLPERLDCFPETEEGWENAFGEFRRQLVDKHWPLYAGDAEAVTRAVRDLLLQQSQEQAAMPTRERCYCYEYADASRIVLGRCGKYYPDRPAETAVATAPEAD